MCHTLCVQCNHSPPSPLRLRVGPSCCLTKSRNGSKQFRFCSRRAKRPAIILHLSFIRLLLRDVTANLWQFCLSLCPDKMPQWLLKQAALPRLCLAPAGCITVLNLFTVASHTGVGRRRQSFMRIRLTEISL